MIDVIEGNRVYIPAVYVLNKIDQISIEELDVIYKIPHCVPISAHHKVRKPKLLFESQIDLLKVYKKPLGCFFLEYFFWGSDSGQKPFFFQRIGK